jgi:hypothetical protein
MFVPFIEFHEISFSYYIVTRSLAISNDIEGFYTQMTQSLSFARLGTDTLIEHTNSPNCIRIPSVTACLRLTKKSRALSSIVGYLQILTLPVLPGASKARFELQLHIADPQIMEIFLVTFLILSQCVL